MIAVAVLAYVASALYSPVPLQLVPMRSRILICTGWGGDGAPPVVGNLLATASCKDRVFVRTCCKNASIHPTPNVAFVTQRQFAGLSLAVEQCLLLGGASDDDCLVLTISPTCDALYGWDTELERLLESCPHKSIITHFPRTTKDGHFACVQRVGSRGIHCSYSPIQDAPYHLAHAVHGAHGTHAMQPVRVLHLTEQMSFGHASRFKASYSRSPSHITSDTIQSWQLHAAGWKYYSPRQCVILATPSASDAGHAKADISWHVDCGLSHDAAKLYRTFADLKYTGSADSMESPTPGTRAAIGVVDTTDEGECCAKYGTLGHPWSECTKSAIIPFWRGGEAHSER